MLANSAIAEEKSDFHITVGGGVAVGPKISATISDYTEWMWSKQLGKGSQLLGGVGYKIYDNLRLEAVFVKTMLTYSKFSDKEAPSLSKAKFKIQPNINSFQVRAYYDVLKLSEDANFYLGTGLGISQLKNSLSQKIYNKDLPNMDRGKMETKSKNNFTWMIGLGADFKMSERMKFALEYNYSDFGKAKKMPMMENNPSFGVHSLLAKISLDI